VAAKSFRCRLVTPTASLLDEQVTYASIPAWDGLFGVMPGRAPLLARLGSGPLTLNFPDSSKGAGGERSYVVDGGFVRMEGSQLTVLAERAVAVETITTTEVEGELQKINARTISGANRQSELDRQAKDRRYAELRLAAAGGRKGI
jgi:F-type H+-transporting ATPase subunit epsilon